MIRKINKNDIDEVYNLGILYDSKFRNHYSLEDYINNPIYIINVFEDDNSIKGFIICTKMFDTVEILLIYVAEEYRKLGIGTALINNLSTEKGITNVMLEVSKENLPAYYLYKKLGFEVISTRKGYYNGIDAYVMKKVL